MPHKFKKGGIVEETGERDIPLSLSKENLKQFLIKIIEGSSEYSHQDFFNWCSKHLGNIIVNDLELEDIGIDEATYEVLYDVNAQWDMYLINEFNIQELQTMDLSKVHLSKEWFQDWLNQLN